jgi:8-oxo-dGTP pyrophosphatase MutT (NUDIX family)
MTEVDAVRHEFRIVDSRDVHIGRIMALRVDQVEMPGGSVAAREVVEHFGAVAVVALDPEDNVVLIHQYRHPLGHRLWELPAGLLDSGTEDPADAARRELAEEVGLAAAEWSVLADLATSPGISDEVVRIFLARGLSEVGREIAEDDEEADLTSERVPLAEAVRMVLAGEIINGHTVAGLLAAHAALTTGFVPRPDDAPWPDRPSRFASRVR